MSDNVGSSAGKGFGLGCGLVAGLLAIPVLLFAWCAGSGYWAVNKVSEAERQRQEQLKQEQRDKK